MREADLGVHHYGLHGGHVLEGGEDLHGVEDAEGFFADFVAQARGAAQHLVEQDSTVHLAQEYQVADLGGG